MARRRRKARSRRRARRSPRRRARRVSRLARRSPLRGRRRRRARRNPEIGADFGLEVMPGRWMSKKDVAWSARSGKRRSRRRLSSKTRRRRRLAKRLSNRSRGIYKRWRGKKRGLRKSVALTQAKRLSTLSRVVRRGKLRRSPVYKAMHIKSNPGLAGVIASAKVIVPQAIVGSLAMGVLAVGGMSLGAYLPAMGPLTPYRGALGTVALTGLAFVAADKVAPKFKGVVAIGGIIAAIVQVANVALAGNALLARAKGALLGEYTMVGGGIFRGGVGEYTMVGSGADNNTEFAHDSLRGMDDRTEFAPGEGGVLQGGIFK